MLSLISACSDPCDDDHAVAPCVECGPGALLRGRALGIGEARVAGSSTGGFVRTCGDADHIVWLGPDLRAAHETEIKTKNADGAIEHLAVNGANEVAAVLLSLDTHADADIYEGELAVYEPDGTQRWRKLVLGNTDVYDGPFVAIGPRRVFMRTDLGPITAYDSNSGQSLWSMPWGCFAADSVGGMVVGTTSSVAAYDDDGVARWSVDLTGSQDTSIVDVASGPNGESAVVGRWSGTDVTIAGTTLAAVDGTTNLFVALFDPSGALQLAQPLGPAYTAGSDDADLVVTSVVTDGHDVIVAGEYEHQPLAFDPEARAPDGQDAFVAAFDASGLAWLRIATGHGPQEANFPGLSTGILGSFYGNPELRVGDVTVREAGTTLAELAR